LCAQAIVRRRSSSCSAARHRRVSSTADSHRLAVKSGDRIGAAIVVLIVYDDRPAPAAPSLLRRHDGCWLLTADV